MTTRKGQCNQRRSLRMEHLETRSLMAGNVLVSVTEGIVSIRGDVAANGVQISSRQTPDGPQLVIAGIPLADAATKINGGADPFVVGGPLRGISLNLAGGNDFLSINNPPPTEPNAPPPPPVGLPGNVNIQLGEGNDRVNGRFNNEAIVSINLGTGNDRAGIAGSNVKQLSVFGEPPPPPAGQTPPPPGNDTVNLENVRSTGPILIDVGGGNDKVKIAGRAPMGGVTILAGDGEDQIEVQGGDTPLAIAALTIKSGGGTDTVTVAHVGIRERLNIETASGNDTVVLDGVRAAGFFAALGEGSDKLTVRGSGGGRATFDGGPGDDLFTDGGDNAFEALLKQNFEAPV